MLFLYLIFFENSLIVYLAGTLFILRLILRDLQFIRRKYTLAKTLYRLIKSLSVYLNRHDILVVYAYLTFLFASVKPFLYLNNLNVLFPLAKK